MWIHNFDNTRTIEGQIVEIKVEPMVLFKYGPLTITPNARALIVIVKDYGAFIIALYDNEADAIESKENVLFLIKNEADDIWVDWGWTIDWDAENGLPENN